MGVRFFLKIVFKNYLKWQILSFCVWSDLGGQRVGGGGEGGGGREGKGEGDGGGGGGVVVGSSSQGSRIRIGVRFIFGFKGVYQFFGFFGSLEGLEQVQRGKEND